MGQLSPCLALSLLNCNGSAQDEVLPSRRLLCTALCTRMLPTRPCPLMLPPPSALTPTGPCQLVRLLVSMFIHHGLRSILNGCLRRAVNYTLLAAVAKS